jgi:hypothetical protein
VFKEEKQWLDIVSLSQKPAFQRLRQKDCEFEDSLSYIPKLWLKRQTA